MQGIWFQYLIWIFMRDKMETNLYKIEIQRSVITCILTIKTL
jgi:hypothetical protein